MRGLHSKTSLRSFICPHFNRLHYLYGERHNVRPLATGILGVRGAPQLEVTPDEDEEDPDPTSPHEQFGESDPYGTKIHPQSNSH